jgi:hypothetical protein
MYSELVLFELYLDSNSILLNIQGLIDVPLFSHLKLESKLILESFSFPCLMCVYLDSVLTENASQAFWIELGIC